MFAQHVSPVLKQSLLQLAVCSQIASPGITIAQTLDCLFDDWRGDPCDSLPDLQLDGNIKSAQAMFMRYDMDLDSRLNQQDYYDLMLELNLALPVQDYQQLVNDIFLYAGLQRLF